MANLPLQDWYETQLAQSWNWAVGLIYVLETPVYTPKTTPTIITVNPWKTNAQLAVINDYDASAKTLTVSAITPLYKAKGVLSTAQSHWTGSKVIISDNYEFWKDLLNTTDNQTITWDMTFDWDATFNGAMNFTAIGDVNVNGKSNPAPVVADTTARDALYTAPVTGDMAWVTSLNALQIYNTATAQWVTQDAGTPAPVATESVQGIMKLHAASADPKAIVSEEAGTSGTAVSASNKLVDNADTTGTGLIIRSSVEASTTVKGIVELATDAEALAGTDETRYINSKQVKDNYQPIGSYIPNNQKFQAYAFSALPTSFAVAHWLSIAPSFVRVKTIVPNRSWDSGWLYQTISEWNYKSGVYSTWYTTTTNGNPPAINTIATTTSTISQIAWENTGSADDMSYTMTISSIDTTNINFAITRTIGAGVTGNVFFIIEFEV